MSSNVDFRAEIARHDWYHTIELAPGVVTPGWFDTRQVIERIPFPSSLEGKRCLDVGTFDGFWAFEMERRGASEVVAIDLLDPSLCDWPVGSEDAVVEALDQRKARGEGFLLAHEALGSSVVRHELNVYDVDEDLGRFDFVYFGSLLLHLRDPVRALSQVAAVCDGEMLCVDAINLALSVLLPRYPVAGLDGLGRPWWWKPNTAGLERMAVAAGLEVIEGPTRLYMPYGSSERPGRPRLRSLLSLDGLENAVHWRRGDPHAAVLVRPRAGNYR